MRAHGGDAGHNGLISIQQVLGHQDYARIRFGIGNEFLPSQQVDYVLGAWSPEEKKELPQRINVVIDMIKSFGILGVERTMNLFNNK